MIWVGEKGRAIRETWNLDVEVSKILTTYTNTFEKYVKIKI